MRSINLESAEELSAIAAYPNRLESPQLCEKTRSTSWTVLVALFVAALVPRLIMAFLVPSVCMDGIGYLNDASAIEHQSVELRSLYGVNIYPYILAFLHRSLGLSPVVTAEAWGVFCSSLAVLPLFGWVRRVFDNRVAIVACLIYAAHAELIEWSPEIVRDQTLWLLLVLGVYCSWRAVVEARIAYFLASGLIIPAAVLTRFEGVFLYIPLVWWVLARCLAPVAPRIKLFAGLTLSILLPLCVVIAAKPSVLRTDSGRQILYMEPVYRVQAMIERISKPLNSSDAPPADLKDRRSISPFSLNHIANSIRIVGRGLSPLYAAMLLGGLVLYWRRFLRSDLIPTVAMNLVTIGAIWVHLWETGVASSRYSLSIAILSTPCAALAVLQFGRYIERKFSGGFNRLAAVPVVVAALTMIGWLDAFSTPYETRTFKADLGRWIDASGGDAKLVVGSDEQLSLIGFYGRATTISLPPDAGVSSLLSKIDSSQSNFVCVWYSLDPQERKLFNDEIVARGFESVELPVGFRRGSELVVLERRDFQQR